MTRVGQFSLAVYSVCVDKSTSTLYDISKFSPPQICSPGSYRPSSKKKSLSIAKRPPAMAGDLQVYRQTHVHIQTHIKHVHHLVAQYYTVFKVSVRIK